MVSTILSKFLIGLWATLIDNIWLPGHPEIATFGNYELDFHGLVSSSQLVFSFKWTMLWAAFVVL